MTTTVPSISDPSSIEFSLSAFAIADWGATTEKGSCCGGKYNNYDLHAQSIVGTLMDLQAGCGVPPQVILGGGDSLYWTGINTLDSRDARFAATYETPYNGENIKNTPWVSVMGNHDYGGADYVCNDGDKLVKCNSTEELLQGLNTKFRFQSEYKSPNNRRWHLDDRFYVYRIENPETSVSIDIFNVDANDADIAGSHDVCCQCYGYGVNNSSGCPNIKRGDKYCCGGDTNMYDTCMKQFIEWSDDSRKQLAEKAASSNATWKIVNSHFSPVQHYKEEGMHKWFNALKGSGVHFHLRPHPR